jgi:hypothetical protein
MSIHFTLLDQSLSREVLGWLPLLLDDHDPRPASEQFDDRYRHGGGWHPIPGFTLPNRETLFLHYDGDPLYQPIAVAILPLTRETIVFYRHEWVAVFKPDRSFEVSRID